jgi:hypothetical protein
MLPAVQAKTHSRSVPILPFSLGRERPASSRRHRAVIRRLVALIALAIAVVFALPASAGTLHTSDDAGVFSASQLTAIRKKVDAYDFDVRLATTSSYASKSELGDYVHHFVTEPNIVVIGLDPVHHHVSVHFGTGTGIPDSAFKSIESAGMSSFKDRDWTGGVTAILDRAESSVDHVVVRTVPGRAAPVRTSSGGGFGLLGLLVIFGFIGFVIWLVVRRRPSGP